MLYNIYEVFPKEVVDKSPERISSFRSESGPGPVKLIGYYFLWVYSSHSSVAIETWIIVQIQGKVTMRNRK